MVYTNIEQIEARVREIPFWWHTIALPFGIKTPGWTPESFQANVAQAIPIDLNGWSVLDLGAWDGYYSFLCEERGARRVLAIDNFFRLDHEGNLSNDRGIEGFYLAKELRHSQVEYRIMDVYDIDSIEEDFDLVLCLGLYYHLKHPLLVFEKIAKKTKQLLIVEGVVGTGSDLSMEFFPGDELNGDPTSWWRATEPCLYAMLQNTGFTNLETLSRSGRILIRCQKRGRSDLS